MPTYINPKTEQPEVWSEKPNGYLEENEYESLFVNYYFFDEKNNVINSIRLKKDETPPYGFVKEFPQKIVSNLIKPEDIMVNR